MKKQKNMKVEILCSRCRASFMGEEWMHEKLGEVLCNDCYAISQGE